MTNSREELISAYLYGTMTSEQYEQFCTWLREDPAHVETYIFEAYLHRSTRVLLDRQKTFAEHAGSLPEDPALYPALDPIDAPTIEPGRTEQIRRMAEQRLAAFLQQEHQNHLQPRRVDPVLPDWRELGLNLWHKTVGTVKALIIMTKVTAVSMAVLLLISVTIFYLYTHQSVATLVDSVDARWGSEIVDAKLRRGPMQLEHGFAQITFTKGATVLLQAPCEYSLESSNRMFLSKGMVTAHVPESAHGFVIQTPRSRVVDFGTEFGVLVDSQERSEVHVFDGQVQVGSQSDGNSTAQTQALTQGQAVRLNDRGDARVEELKRRPELFCRSMAAARTEGTRLGRSAGVLDLADILGRGDGFGSGQLDQGVDPITGHYCRAYSVPYNKHGQGRYVGVPHNVFIDGVFVPQGPDPAPVVTSQGHLFTACPQTSGMSYGEIRNTREQIVYGHMGNLVCLPEVAGNRYERADRPHIFLHANAGITFDLDAIRKQFTRRVIKRFRAECGVCTEALEDPAMDFFVLVDGEVRFSAFHMNRASGAISINVPLRSEERFLSLLATEGPDTPHADVGLFGQPVLELETKKEL